MSCLIPLPSPSSAVPPPAAACSSILAFKSCCERRNLCCCGFSFPIFSNSASSSATCIASAKFQYFYTSPMTMCWIRCFLKALQLKTLRSDTSRSFYMYMCHFYIIQHWVKMCIFMYAWNYFKLMNHLGTMSTQWTCIFVNLYGIEVSHLRLDSLFNPSINFYNQRLGLLPHSLVTIFQKFGQFGDKRFNRHDFISKIPIRKQNFLYVLMDTD